MLEVLLLQLSAMLAFLLVKHQGSAVRMFQLVEHQRAVVLRLRPYKLHSLHSTSVRLLSRSVWLLSRSVQLLNPTVQLLSPPLQSLRRCFLFSSVRRKVRL